MPSKSLEQAIAMRMAAAGKSNTDIPQSVGREYVEADRRAGKFQSTARAHRRKKYAD